MKSIEVYSLILCLTVLVGLVSLFSWFLTHVIKQRIKLIAFGDEDRDIIKEHESSGKEKTAWDIIAKVFSTVVTLALCAIFSFAIYVNLSEDKKANGIPSLKIVRTDSMSYKNDNNGYLEKNELNDQLQVFDLIVTRHLPDEFELELYDIVVYQAKSGDMIIHRIVGIEEPNEKHPDCRHFKLQGDAVPIYDTYPVLYSQMKGIYLGERVPFVGSFILFLQSPAGYFCIALVICSFIALPIMEKKIDMAKKERLELLLKEDEE